MFKRVFDRRIYEIIYMLEKFFKCSICEKFFSYKINLKFYEMIYIGEMFYVCFLCSRRFR